MAPKKPARVVYSSEHGRVCSACGEPVKKCKCAGRKAAESRPDTDGVVRVRRERKGRGGKTVTTVTGLEGELEEIKAIAKTLKKKCGAGGSVKDWVVIIQGDKVDTVVAVLKKKGVTVKVSGG